MLKNKTYLKLMIVLGTRPEIIKLLRTIILLDEHLHLIIVHTGQTYDYKLNQIFFDDLKLPCFKYQRGK